MKAFAPDTAAGKLFDTIWSASQLTSVEINAVVRAVLAQGWRPPADHMATRTQIGAAIDALDTVPAAGVILDAGDLTIITDALATRQPAYQLAARRAGNTREGCRWAHQARHATALADRIACLETPACAAIIREEAA